ncbi:MAG: beta-glucosidase [Anaerolineae bacterium]|nr:beta-glucosidase [Anaerolineae bacterium]
MPVFPDGFLWGAATSSYQVEGAVSADGRGPSIWDTFCKLPGKIAGGDTGDAACDHYNRCHADVDIMAGLGLQAYRFSIAWPRVLPEGVGAVNEAGLDFYDRLVDALLAKGITPYPTLYHWDLPQALEDAFGGWPSREIVPAFVHYADVVSRRLGDRVHNWMTLNEPWVSAFLGYSTGFHAPGANDPALGVQASHHLLLAHGQAAPALRANGGAQTRVGIALDLHWVDAATDSEADRAAAYRQDGIQNRWFLDPVFKGAYPEDIVEMYRREIGTEPDIHDGDMAAIAAPIDFLGINYYFRNVVKADESVPVVKMRAVKPEGEYTEMGWEVHPESLYKLLVHLKEAYNPPALYITENGAAFTDRASPEGQVSDPRRAAYLRAHFAASHRAIAAGAPLRGYFVWSLMDNFEWSFGYSKRFGIVYVDFETQQRIVKQSGAWYAEVIKQNGFDHE